MIAQLGGASAELPRWRSADEVAVHLGPRRLAAHARTARSWPPLLVVIGVLCQVTSELGSIRPLRKSVFLYPLALLVVAVGHRRAARLSGAPRPASAAVPLGLVAYLLWVVASTSWAADVHDSRRQALEFIAYAVDGAVLALVLPPRLVHQVFVLAAKAYITMTAIMMVVAYHAATQPVAADPVAGWHGPFGHKNTLGFLMAVSLVALVLETPRPRRQTWWIIAAAVLLVGSQSGAGLAVVLAVGSIGLWGRTVRSQLTVGRRLLVKFASGVLFASGAVLLVTDYTGALSLLGKNPTLTGRTRIWASVVHEIAQSPLHGYGYGGVWLDKTGETLRLWGLIGFPAYEAHDAYLDLVLQLGFVGALLFSGVLLAALIRSGSRFVRGTAVDRWVALTLVAFVIEAGVESDLFGEGMITISALVVTAFKLRRQDAPLRSDVRPPLHQVVAA